jgi:hypothetical protein
MLIRTFARPHVLAIARLPRAVVSRAYSETVGPLVYDLHEPARPVSDKQTAPILFLHGLFGSKKNNRGISKYVACAHRVAARRAGLTSVCAGP